VLQCALLIQAKTVENVIETVGTKAGKELGGLLRYSPDANSSDANSLEKLDLELV